MIAELTSADVRAARALAQWSQDQLAKAAGVGVSTIADFEKGTRKPIANNIGAIRRAFEETGVVFTLAGPVAYHVVVLYFLAEDDAAELVLRYQQTDAFAVQEIVGIFGTIQGAYVSLVSDQIVTPELRAAIDRVVTLYAGKVPQLHKLKQKIACIPDGKFFLLLPAAPTSTRDRLALETHLHWLNNPEAEPDEEVPDTLFGPLLDLYDMTNPRTDRRNVIGTGGKARTCRFCHRSSGQVTFKKAAHVIPTALGNDHLKSAEECDDCNEYFGQATEPSLIAMLDVQRVFLGTQGRGKNDGRPKLKFGNDTMYHDGTKVVLASQSRPRVDGDTFEITLGRGARMVPMAAYRALVKIVLSVVDASHLPDLQRTVAWVRHGMHADQPLPTVAMATINLPPDPSAQITVYTRRQPHAHLPHIVGEFRLGPYLLAFAVPFSARDSGDLVDFFNMPDFQDTFRHYMEGGQWAQSDLSGTLPIAISPQLRMVRR